MTISIDPSSEAMLRRAGAATFLDWVRDVDALLPNADEARLLSGCEDPLDAAMALTEIATQVVVTLGADGALWAGRSNPDPVHVPASPVDVVDTTGAGDAFTAGWLVSSLAGSRPEVALAEACGLAARAVSQVGARPR